MKTAMKFLVGLMILAGCKDTVIAQVPYQNDIQAFKKADSISSPPNHAIVFVGSSSFTKWTDVADYFPGYTIINRGFGGSTLPDVIRFAPETILKYHPKQVLVYCGDNDLASSDTVTPLMVLSRFKTLFNIIRKNEPQANIAYVSIKPSPSRAHLMPKMEKTNAMIKAFLAKQKNSAFINIYDAMLGAGHKPRSDIFIEDNLHMNAKGYAIWQEIIKPYLLK
jgi:lysophospholipase L1-like esterase